MKAQTTDTMAMLDKDMKALHAQGFQYIYISIGEEVSFRDNESTRRYIDTAICQNIQHSLKCFKDGTRFMKLRKLYQVFKYQFLGGGFDMVVYDEKKNSCTLFEIKHSKEAVAEQCRHLLDEESCRSFEERIAPVLGKKYCTEARAFNPHGGLITKMLKRT